MGMINHVQKAGGIQEISAWMILLSIQNTSLAWLNKGLDRA